MILILIFINNRELLNKLQIYQSADTSWLFKLSLRVHSSLSVADYLTQTVFVNFIMLLVFMAIRHSLFPPVPLPDMKYFSPSFSFSHPYPSYAQHPEI